MADVAFIALGSNLGDRAAYLDRARCALSLLEGSRLLAASRVEETAPFGDTAQPPYLNQMIALRTPLEPARLLAELHRVERSLGRVRRTRWGARTIDLDLVCLGDRTSKDPGLLLPHPGLESRTFWQREAAELRALLAAA